MILPAVRERLERLLRHPSLDGALGELRAGAGLVGLSGLQDVAKALAAAYFTHELRRPAFFLTENNRRAEDLAESVRFFGQIFPGVTGGVAVLPAFDNLPWDPQPPHADILERRAATLYRLANGEVSLVIAPMAAALWRYQDPYVYLTLAQILAKDSEVSHEALIKHLGSIGYARTEMVDLPGQFAVRGGIIDVFSPEALRPVRIELLGDTVESVREFDPRTQRSVAPVNKTTILPLTEWSVPAPGSREAEEWEPGRWMGATSEAGGSALFELAESSLKPIVFLDAPVALREAGKKLQEAATENYERHGHANSPEVTHYFWSEADWERALVKTSRMELEQLNLAQTGGQRFELSSRPSSRFHGDVVACLGDVKSQLASGGTVYLTAASLGELERYADICREYEVPYVLGETEEAAAGFTAESATESAALVLVRAPFAQGVSFPDAKLTIYGNADLFDVTPSVERPSRKIRTSGFFADFAELKPGDYVVHVDHGIGQFEGLRLIESEGRRGEFMLLRYADDARLYVPLERMDLVQSYRVVEGSEPTLDKLGGTSWATRKTRVRKSLEDMADQLLALYAERKTAEGFAFSPDGAWQREFENAFEFEETADQRTAIADIKKDLEKPIPMDRLLCGDVGYGKTEVAMRAAFKAVADGKQIAVLTPTTVLAFQHFETFKKRFAAFPTRIEMLSRFRTAAEQKVILADLEAGKVDIVIGTHRLLSKDIKFQDLGLLIVDEEQRFGVAHKERLKEMRKNVHALALSATPIPRTLHMSLVGLRDMSLIETPPRDRLAIHTVVAHFDPEVVKASIEQEMSRGGQVYFVHNRVNSIFARAASIQALIPNCRIGVGHGQMDEKELERVLLGFMRHEYDVFVCTTIVENGFEIPLANTIIIENAERYGLSEMYQLRGRVGRSSRRAYAYLLVPADTELSEIARKRLAALREFSDLGAGFKIAALDLELRGAGNLLGGEQHGHIAAVGFDMYLKMLDETVQELKGEETPLEVHSALNLGLDIRIPPAYIADEHQRLRAYKRIADAKDLEQADKVRGELEDRYGPAPVAVGTLFAFALLKTEAEKLGVEAIDRRGSAVQIKFHPGSKIDPSRLMALVSSVDGAQFTPAGVLRLPLDSSADTPGGVLAFLEKSLQTLVTNAPNP